MSKKNEDRRNQREFLFVFNGESKTQQCTQRTLNAAGASESEALTPDVAKSHRDRLIEELREFGC